MSGGVELAEIVAAIGLAADLGLGQPLDHVLRSTVIATDLAERLRTSETDRDATYWTTMILSAGCIGVSFELSTMFGDDVAFRAGMYSVGNSNLDRLRYLLACAAGDRGGLERVTAQASMLWKARTIEAALLAHCGVSGLLTDRLALGTGVTASLRQAFTSWDGSGLPKGLAGDDIALPIRIANLANVVEVRTREQGIDAAIELVGELSGSFLDPRLTVEWSAIAREQVARLDAAATWDNVIAIAPVARGPLNESELDAALELLGDYADLKSPYFTGHSRAVADLAAAAGQIAGLAAPALRTLRHAALVHDLGRCGVPNSIWDKPSRLSASELERARLHAYLTDRVLRRCEGLADLASVASAAHERIGGTGYPRSIAGQTIPSLARYLEPADVYCAMTEDRPHRAAHSAATAASELRRAAAASELDGGAVDAVLAAAGHPSRSRPSAPADLTPREVEVLVFAARGLTTKAIGSRLGISPKTAGNHLERIYNKIGVNSRAEAALFAMQSGLLD